VCADGAARQHVPQPHQTRRLRCQWRWHACALGGSVHGALAPRGPGRAHPHAAGRGVRTRNRWACAPAGLRRQQGRRLPAVTQQQRQASGAAHWRLPPPPPPPRRPPPPPATMPPPANSRGCGKVSCCLLQHAPEAGRGQGGGAAGRAGPARASPAPRAWVARSCCRSQWVSASLPGPGQSCWTYFSLLLCSARLRCGHSGAQAVKQPQTSQPNQPWAW